MLRNIIAQIPNVSVDIGKIDAKKSVKEFNGETDQQRAASRNSIVQRYMAEF